MGPGSPHAPLGDEHNRIGPVEHERARRHDDRRPAGPRIVELGRDPGLRVRVDRARRLDEHQDLRIPEQCPGEHESLPLTSGERAASLVDELVETVRQRSDHVLGRSDLDRGEDLVVARP